MTNSEHLPSPASENQWKSIYTFGAITTIIVLIGTILDIVFGSITGGNLTALPQTAESRFIQLQNDFLLGIYNLDFLNVVNQLMLIFTYLALYGAHRRIQQGYAMLALIIYLVGTVIFVAGNVALPMAELSAKYTSASDEKARFLFAAAGEAMMVKGTHGTLGVFLSFFLPNLAGIIMSWAMLRGRVFSRTTALMGFIGSILMALYIILVTFVPGVQQRATLFAAPGGLMLMAWMVLITIRFFRLVSPGE